MILTTGHEFPEADEAPRSYYPSLWSRLINAQVPAVRIGVLGTSLSGIDAVIEVATQHGAGFLGAMSIWRVRPRPLGRI